MTRLLVLSQIRTLGLFSAAFFLFKKNFNSLHSFSRLLLSPTAITLLRAAEEQNKHCCLAVVFFHIWEEGQSCFTRSALRTLTRLVALVPTSGGRALIASVSET